MISVHELKNKIKNEKDNKIVEFQKNAIFDIEKLLDLRLKIRNKWKPEDRLKYDTFLLRLNVADQNFKKELVELIIAKTQRMLRKNINTTTFKLWMDKIKMKNSEFKNTTLMYGFWDIKTKRFSRIKNFEAGIKETPLEYVNNQLNKLGYKIEDVSNTSLSFQKLLLIHLENT